ncbi:ribosome assembly RNA-binding protein YhbY [Anoxybacillus sp.]|uniref:ribosome assembly RNA-binding protein YhbY n=1 Tax=Anoxybacillus sp. TaxID=1872573 RepID=UPI00261CB90C|nr:ribosome assembly RNA-binding protein YhbY [uncultured Anoxybacillus sp.]
MLTGKQKRFLRSLAHHLTPIFQVGKSGVNDNMIKQIADALEARELIKVSVLKNCEEEKEVVAEQLAKGAGAEIVQLIGHTIVLYKESREHKQIVLPT